MVAVLSERDGAAFEAAAGLKAPAKRAKKPKYHNTKCTVDGNKFDSKGESEVYGELLILERAGQIDKLEWRKTELRMPLIVNGMKVSAYTPDFRYFDKQLGRTVYLDVKSPATAQERYFQLRVKLVLALYGIRIEVRIIDSRGRKPKRPKRKTKANATGAARNVGRSGLDQ